MEDKPSVKMTIGTIIFLWALSAAGVLCVIGLYQLLSGPGWPT